MMTVGVVVVVLAVVVGVGKKGGRKRPKVFTHALQINTKVDNRRL